MAEEETLLPDYSFTQQSLYSMSRTIVNAAKETADQAKLAAHKALYTTTYLDGLLTQVTAAESLPGEVSREDEHETDRVDLVLLLKPCLDNFQATKSYIDTAYAKEYRKIKYDTAGGAKYEKASNENWEFAEAMNNDLLTFLTANQTLLEDNDNMPTTFIAKVTADNLAFHTKYEDFKTARQTSDETQAKITANNLLYDKISMLAKDGVLVWKDNEGKRNRFVMAKVLEMITPPGSASLQVELQYFNFQPAFGYTIVIQSEGKAPLNVVTIQDPDQKGSRAVANYPNLDPARYNWSVLANDANKTVIASGKKEVDTGVNARLKIVLPSTVSPE